MKLRDFATWDRLRDEDLIYNNVIRVGSSQILADFQERLQRRRYIGNDNADVRTVLPCVQVDHLICVIPGICGAPGRYATPFDFDELPNVLELELIF